MMQDDLKELRRRLSAKERLTKPIDRGIGSCYATIRAAFHTWGQPMNRDTAPDLQMMLDAWRARFGHATVTRTLELITAEAEAGQHPLYGADARANV